ncbi:tyrosinase family oxidase copper chaperone [Streptomyces prasinopilosus]|uniref:tyrosinase family oxidase copper chaperone n=1 Tax=Streptomyces prasinopilosus TaxID=67344 RepID=UPI0006EB3A5E|nr:tyrosinase family oxidase copper chaperone [Streptomyces prasinopilosus]
MNVPIDPAPTGAGDTAPRPAPPGPAGRTRRDVARGLRAGALAGALAPVLAAFRSPRPGPAETDPPGGSAPAFAQTYRGRRLRGVWTPGHTAAEDGRWHVTVDGRPLHLMRRADGGWLSTVDHYCSYRTPLEAARAAVDALGPGERLREAAPGDTGHAHGEGRHGVRA